MTELLWTDWEGGDCPLKHDQLTVVRWRDRSEWRGHAAAFQWHHATEPRAYDIVAYLRPEEPTPSASPSSPA